MPTPEPLTVAELNVALFGRSDARAIATPALIQQMLDSGDGIRDLVFSPGRPPQVERFGELTTVPVAELPVLKAEDTAAISQDLIRNNELVLRTLRENGSTDLSYALPNSCRFRVNVFRQRGTFAIVMRMIAKTIPTIQELGLPPALLGKCADKAAFFPILEQMYQSQEGFLNKLQAMTPAQQQQLQTAKPVDAIKMMAQQMGLIDFAKQRGIPEAKAMQCLGDMSQIDRWTKQTQDKGADGTVTGTPTLLINGKKTDVSSWGQFEPLLKGAGA